MDDGFIEITNAVIVETPYGAHYFVLPGRVRVRPEWPIPTIRVDSVRSIYPKNFNTITERPQTSGR